MDEKREPEKRTNFRRSGNANATMTLRLLAAGIVLYWLWQIVSAYIKGGPDAPSLGVLLLGIVVLGGGAVFVAWLALRTYKQDKADAEMTQEEINAMEALREEAPAETSEDEADT